MTDIAKHPRLAEHRAGVVDWRYWNEDRLAGICDNG
jgi:hypothetical protein